MNARTCIPKIGRKLLGAIAGLALLAGPLCAQVPQIASGDDFTAVIDSNNNLYTYGSNSSGQLGIGDETAVSGQVYLVEPAGVWQSVAVSKNAVGSSAGTANGLGHVLAVRTDGTLWAWGLNDRGQLGLGHLDNQNEPQQVSIGQVTEVAAGTNFSMARTVSGQVFIWGDNTSGQLAREISPQEDNGFGTPLGAGGNALNSIPIPVLLDDHAYISIAAGLTSAVAVRADGTLYAWGFSDTRQLGYNISTATDDQKFKPTIVPHRIGSGTGWTEVFSGNALCFALKGGQLYTWGFAFHRGTTNSNYDTPVRVGSASDWENVSIGYDHTLALKNGGELWGWGNNSDGELGIEIDYTVSGWNLNFSSPKRLESGTVFGAIGAGQNFSSIYTSDGFLLTSGVNNTGQLGNGIADNGKQFDFKTGVLGTADLVAESLNVTSATVTAGSVLNANVFLNNAGTGAITDDFDLAVVLSPFPYYSEFGTIALAFDSGETVTTDIAAGVTISHPIVLNIPTDIPVGNYYLILRADAGEVLTEVTRTNNDVIATDDDSVNEIFDFLADLQIVTGDISVDPDPDTVGAIFPLGIGDPMNVTYTITNEGNGSLTASTLDTFVQRVVLSETNDLSAPSYIEFVPDDPSDLVEDQGLAAGASITRTVRFTIPTDLGVGEFYLGVSVDDATDTANDFGAIEESNEENNFAFTALPDVEISGIELEEALDTVLYTTPIDFSFTTSSTPGGLRSWFGQTIESYDNEDAARSPGLAVGQSATFTQDGFTTEAVIVTFRWKAQTSSESNYLYFGLGGVEVTVPENSVYPSRISGTTDWVEVSHIVPPNSQMTWTYVQGTDSPDDVVYVDTVTVTSLAEPDLVVNSVTGQAGSYILGSDSMRLSISNANQGATTTMSSGIDFDIGIYLSQDPSFTPESDILIDSLPIRSQIVGGNEFYSLPNIPLADDIPSGSYYLIVVTDDGDNIDEGVAGEFNNIYVSDAADVEILALPDIKFVDDSFSSEPGYYVVGGEDVTFSFSITNDGLQGVTDEFTIKIVLSRDNVPDNGDYEVASLPFTRGLPVGAVRSISPDTFEIPGDVPIGERLYFGVILDANNEIAEQDETNNAEKSSSNDFVFSEVPIGEAFDLGISASFDDSTFYPFNGALPWYGYEHDLADTPAYDLSDSIRNIDITHNEAAVLEFTVEVGTPRFVTFKWKVSSEHNDTLGKYDTLNFYVDDLVNPVRSISGEVDWHIVSYPVSVGTHTLRWAYVKDGSVDSGDDAGWLDEFTLQDADLSVRQISLAAGSYVPGASINDFEFTVENIGDADLPSAPAYTISIIASLDTEFGNDGDNVVATIVDDEGLSAGAFRDYLTDLLLPASLPQGQYYLGVKVDSLELIAETNEANNVSFTVTPVMDVVPSITLNEAIDDPNIGAPEELDLTIGGQQGWFTVANALLPDGTSSSSDGVDAAQSGPILAGETSYFQTIYAEGPQELKFRWKVNSTPNSNILRFTINDEIVEQISGEVDWDYGYGGFTLTYQGDETVAIGSGAPASDVEAALNALGTIIADGGVTVAEVLTSGSSVPLEYEITFVSDENKAPLIVAFLDSQKVNSTGSAIVTDTNGGTSVFEVQRLTINPAVTFRLGFEGVPTANLLYTATAAEVEAALDLIIPGGVTVTGADLDFDVVFDTFGEMSAITVDTTGLDQPGTVDAEITIAGDVAINQEQQLRIGPEITVFIPAGSQELRWTYSKTTTGEGTLDAAWVDQVQFTTVTEPELVLTGLNYTPGEYVLDVAGIATAPNQLLGTEYLDITVEAENQGAVLPAAAFTSADLEVRLSIDAIYGNSDDIVLGTVSQVEGDLNPGNLMRFIGPIQLGDSIPENTYYLMARIDSNDSTIEYSEDNNIMISANRDIQITRLPALRIFNPDTATVYEDSNGVINALAPREGGSVAFDLDEDFLYYDESPMRLRFAVQNIGLDRVEGSVNWTIAVNLRGGRRTDLDGATEAQDVVDALDISIELGEFTVQELMLGRSADNPTGDVIDIDLDLALPDGARLNSIIDEELTIADYLWIIDVTLDSNDVVRESQIVTESPQSVKPSGLPWWIVNPVAALTSDMLVTNTDQDEGLFGISFQPELMTAADWETLYPGYSTAVSDNLLAYAFNRNPVDGDTVGGQFPGTSGVSTYDGDDYLTIAFDIVTRADDLIYTVEAANDLSFVGADELVVIQGAYDELTGINSLTGDGGLIDDGEVTSVLDQGYSARVTIKDIVDTETEPMRFIRVVVTETP